MSTSLDAKFKILKPYLQGKRVLDVGCVGDLVPLGSVSWIHHKIGQVAGYVLGIDILEEEIKKLQAKGYNVQVGDIQNTLILDDEGFDVVFAGEVIEHLTNFEGFFRAIRTNLRAGGVLILTTPNVHSVYRFLALLLGKPTARKEHTVWFDHCTISNLLHRFGFKILISKFVKVTSLKDVVLTVMKFRSLRSIIDVSSSFLVETTFPSKIGKRDLVIVAKKMEA